MADLDPDLLRLVDALPRTPFAGADYRHLGPHHPPMSGEGARIRGGRWNPEDSFPTLYLGTSHETVVAEFYRHAERQGMPAENLLPRRFHEYRIELAALLDVRRKAARDRLGLSGAVLRGLDASRCQAVGDCAHYAGYEGIIAPSATGKGEVIAVFMDRILGGSAIQLGPSTTWEREPNVTDPSTKESMRF